MSPRAPFTFLLLLLTTPAMAQPAETDVIALRAEAEQLEEKMYTLFNALNSTDDFDVACGHKAPTGSTIPVWQCDAAFMRDARVRDMSTQYDNPTGGAANTQNGFIPQSGQQLSFKNRKKTQALNDEMMALARQHPELASAMIALNAKRQQLETAGK
ncbi:MAG: hypothetical protein RLZZ227_1282 [Pseudomonadota bacterium]|jgi:hypothetical protein